MRKQPQRPAASTGQPAGRRHTTSPSPTTAAATRTRAGSGEERARRAPHHGDGGQYRERVEPVVGPGRCRESEEDRRDDGTVEQEEQPERQEEEGDRLLHAARGRPGG